MFVYVVSHALTSLPHQYPEGKPNGTKLLAFYFIPLLTGRNFTLFAYESAYDLPVLSSQPCLLT